ncbi:uncharacterized protein LOC143694800 isoform X3 [Agelaius phoeniceus]|uniref:uncharacterized protein LOC143694800 isoform X3 n=1 Tax=Agelaius phoeniceus TaxID=39638 RepID=UPI004055273A
MGMTEKICNITSLRTIQQQCGETVQAVGLEWGISQEPFCSQNSRWLQGQCSSFREPQLSWLAQGKVATGLPQQQNASSGKPQLHAGHNG